MEQRKKNSSPWRLFGLAALLCAAAVAIAAAPAMARYRTEREMGITFEVRSPAQICLGTVGVVMVEDPEGKEPPQEKEVFNPDAKPEWETSEDTWKLELAVANGLSEEEFSKEDQSVQLQLLGTLGLWTDTNGAAEICLRLPSEAEGEAYTEVQAVVSAIEENTALYNTHGDGWIYRFEDAQGQELTWTLPGGVLSYIQLTVVMKNAAPSNISLLQPQIIANLVKE